jgi:endonuclease YncB( thermonuclease family)
VTAKPGQVVRLLLAVLLAGFLPASWACTGRVVGVTDGDTVKVLCEGVETKVRLNQTVAPDPAQASSSTNSPLAVETDVTVVVRCLGGEARTARRDHSWTSKTQWETMLQCTKYSFS